jgi:hypothetical protein
MPKSKRKKKQSQNKSGYIGVSQTSSGKYAAAISIDRKKKNLGSSYVTAKQAAKAYDKEAITLRRPVSKLNFPKKAPVGYTPMQQALTSRNIHGYRGVSKNGNRFSASITIGADWKHTYIGNYGTPKEAAIAYDRAVLKANQCTSLLNFPDMVHNLDVEPKRTKFKRSSTGYRGVTKKANGKFKAQISIGNGKQTSLGTFGTAIQAALAYDQAAIKKGYPKSKLNYSKDQKKQKKQEKEKKQEKQKKQVKEKKQKKQKKTKKKDLLAIQEYKEMLEIWNDME